MSTIISTMQMLGYSPNAQGVCFGIAMMGSQAIIRDQSQAFIDRINFVKNASEETMKSLAAPFDRKIKKELHEKKVDLCCFFDELSIYQGKNSVNKEFKSIVPDQGADNVKKLADAPQNDHYVYPKITQNIIDLFTYGEFFDFILKIKSHFVDHSFSIVISHSPNDHATQIGFDAKQKQWVSLDHDYVVAGSDKFDDIKKVVDNIFLSQKYPYGRIDELAISLDIILSEKDENIKEQIDLSSLKKNAFNLERLTKYSNKEALSHLISSYEHASRYSEMIAIFDKIKLLNLSEKENIQLLESKRTTDLTLFHFLIEKKEADVLQALFKKAEEMQLSPDGKFSILSQKNNYFPSSLLNFALKYRHVKVIQVLINVIKTIKSEQARSKLLGAKISNGFSPLLTAAYNGNEKIVQALVDGIVSIKDDRLKAKLLGAKNSDGVSALLVAATMGDQEIAQVLIDAISSIKDNQLKTKLLEASVDNQHDMLSALLVAAQKGHVEIVQLLTNAICSIKDCKLRAKLLEAKNNDGLSALLLAKKNGHTEVAKILVNAIHSMKTIKIERYLLCPKLSEQCKC